MKGLPQGMVNFRQSLLPDLLTSQNFLWCTGIEDTFITAPSPKTGRILDEYELTEHYTRCSDDLNLIGSLGVKCARYGIPWHRINPRPGVWEWQWADEPLEKLLSLGVAPIVDLVHYGLPPWIENAFLHPDYPRFVADYASRVAARFKGRIHAYTPLNEPRITAWYCGRIGWWPPFRHGWRGYAAVMQAVCRGIVATVGALRAIDPEILPVHVDATDLYQTNDPALESETRHRQDLVFLALDLISGRVSPDHGLHDWCRQHGFTATYLEWFQTHAVPLPMIGINLYPMFTNKILSRSAGARVRLAMKYANGALIEQLAALYWNRYHAPLFISETASSGSVRRRQQWLGDSVHAVQQVRSRGLPLIGYTWWPLFALVTWAYRQGRNTPQYYLKQMGLWDLDSKFNRVPTTLVAKYRELVESGCAAVGQLSALPEVESA